MFNLISEYPVSALFYLIVIMPVAIIALILVGSKALHAYKMSHAHDTKAHCAQYYRMHYEYEFNHPKD